MNFMDDEILLRLADLHKRVQSLESVSNKLQEQVKKLTPKDHASKCAQDTQSCHGDT
jgi:hypothetical protein